MFKKLRNKMLIVNTLIIASLVLGSFSVIYLMTAQNIERGINQRLHQSLDIVRMSHKMERNPHMPKGEDFPPQGQPPQRQNHARDMFSMTFTVITDAEGNIVQENIPFDIDEDFYSDKILSILHNSLPGTIKSENGLWKYSVATINNGFAIAFTEVQDEYIILRNLVIILLFVGLVALAITFLISLFFANRSIKPVEESYNKQKQFVADASHELKTPLTTINTNVDVLLSHPESTIGNERKWLEYIKTESQRMTKLTNDLLYLARLDHSEGNVIMSKVSFSDAAENVILLMEAVAFEKDVNLAYDIQPDLYVKGSMEQLKQVVMILLDNAIKYTPKKGDIKISLKQENGDAVLTVHNTGEGISEEAQKQIFERFYREDKSRARESGGYGLGLAIAKAVVKQCKGSIKVSSKKNEYTLFTVRIPASK